MSDPLWKTEYPFEPHVFDLDGLRYSYVDEGAAAEPSAGQGGPLLFVHGNPTWSFAWRRLISPLSATHRCIAVDHIGCGLSDKPQEYEYRLARHVDNLVRLIRHLDLQDVTLVAHDWGGAIGMGAAVREPDRFSRFVLMNTAAFRSDFIPLRIAACRIPLLGAFGVRGLNLFARAALRMAVADCRHLTPAARAGYLAPYDSWAHRVAVHRFVLDIPRRPAHPSYDTLKQIEQGLEQFRDRPMQLIWGLRDWCFHAGFLKEFQRRFPQADSLELEEAGHYLFEDAPEAVLEGISQFLDRAPAGHPALLP